MSNSKQKLEKCISLSMFIYLFGKINSTCQNILIFLQLLDCFAVILFGQIKEQGVKEAGKGE